MGIVELSHAAGVVAITYMLIVFVAFVYATVRKYKDDNRD